MPLDPTFIIAGAPRCGTTWLYDLCNAHPDIHMARPKRPEPKFFLVDEEYAKGIEYYREIYFADCAGATARGEKSTNYLESPNAAERIRRHLPDAKLIFILRNPIERAYSNFLWSTANGLETLDFPTALRREAQRESAYTDRHRYARPFSYASRGMYARHLLPYLRLFDESQILILLLDDIVASPRHSAARLLSHIGISDLPPDFSVTKPVNATPRGAPPIPDDTHDNLARLYRRPNAELADIIGRDLSSWNSRESEPKPECNVAVGTTSL